MPKPPSLTEVSDALACIRLRLEAIDLAPEASQAIRSELRELVVSCRIALRQQGLLFRYSGFLRLADHECLRHCDRLFSDDARGARAALVKACGHLEECLQRALGDHAKAAECSAIARSA